MKKRVNRVVALLLCLIMVLQTLPSNGLGFEGEETPSSDVVENYSEDTTDGEPASDSEDEAPADGEAEQPDDGEAEQPDDGEAEQPDDGEAEQPDDGEAEQPDDGDAEQPDDGDAEQPDDGDAEQPDDGDAEQPDDSEAEQPDDGDAEQPDDSEAEQPDDGDAEQPDDGDAEQPGDGEAERPDDEEDFVAPAGIDFSSRRVLVATYDPSIFDDGENVQSIDGYVYLLSYDTEGEAVKAYNYYSKVADLVEADIPMSTTAFTRLISIDMDIPLSAPGFAFSKADDEMGTMELTNTDTYTNTDTNTNTYANIGAEHYDIALIDTGVAEEDEAAAVLSVIGEDGVDINGHGSAMYTGIKIVDDDDTLSVLSIQAFNGRGQGYMSDVYKAVLLATDANVSVISMACTSNQPTESSGEILQLAIDRAADAGIVVVFAAGDDDTDVSKYLPARLEGVYIVGACDGEGKRIDTSNYGEEIFCNVVADHTSEAAAILAALIAEYGLDYVLDEAMNNGLVFAPDYEGAEKYDGEYEEHFDLVEVPASTNDPLLAISKLSDETLAVIDAGPEAEGDASTDDPEDQPSVTVDNVSIEYVQIRWLTNSTGSDSPAYFDTLELAPEGQNLANQQFQIDFALSGQKSYQPGEIELVLPSYLWLDRNGKVPGYLTMSVPENESRTAEFVWGYRDGMVVITNNKELAPASKVMIQGTFRGVNAPDMVDETESIPNFAVTLTVRTPSGNTVSKTSNAIKATIDTKVEAIHATKSVYNKKMNGYDIWWGGQPNYDLSADSANVDNSNSDYLDKELLETMPEEFLARLGKSSKDELDDYAIVRWYIDGTAAGSQPFEMYVEDTIWGYNEETGHGEYGGIMLGVTGATEGGNGVVVSKDGVSVTALLYNGFTTSAVSAYVWTAYLQSEMPEDEMFNIQNKQTIRVVGWDDEIDTTAEAEAILPTRVPKIYKFVKFWDDKDNVNGHRPGYMYLYIYNDQYSNLVPWRTIRLTPDYATENKDGKTEEGKDASNNWTYEWSDNGTGAIFKAEEGLVYWTGVIDESYDDEGHRMVWAYHLKGQGDFEKETNTWTFTNVYTEGWGGFPLSTISKSVEYKYRDNSLIREEGKDTNSLNALLRGEDVLVTFYVSASLSAASQSVMGGVKPNLFTLEDSEYYFNDQYDFTVEDIDIAQVELSVPTVWKYDTENVDENGWYQREQVYEIGESVLYGRMEENGEQIWIELAKIDKDGNITSLNDGVEVWTNGKGVNLPVGIAGVKLVLESDQAIVDMKYTLTLRIHPTENVQEMIKYAFRVKSELQSLPIYNKTVGYINYNGEVSMGGYNRGDEIDRLSAVNWGYIHGKDYKVAANLEKTFELMDADNESKDKRSVKFETTLTLTQQSNITSRSEYDIARAEGDIPDTMSGTFYDLLPYGVEPDLNTLKLSDGYIESYYTRSNYKDSGRTLLVVNAKFTDNPTYLTDPQSGYGNTGSNGESDNPLRTDDTYPKEGFRKIHTLTFDSWCPLEIATDEHLGVRYMKNLAAYEADESGNVGSAEYWQGQPDNPGGGETDEETEENKNHKRSKSEIGEDYFDLMTGLDKDHNGEDLNFVYAGADVIDSEIDMTAAAGLQKYVTAGGGAWTDGLDGDVNVPENGQYSYRLVLTNNGEDTETSNIILYDSIEKYVPKEGQEGYEDNRWVGTLLSIDLTHVIESGIAPVVYVSMNEDMDVDEFFNAAVNQNPDNANSAIDLLTNSNGEWIKLESNEKVITVDPGVKAIAIDMRHKTDGSDFVLKDYEFLEVKLNMRAPCDMTREKLDYFKDRNGELTDGLDPARNAHAYNSTSWSGTQSTGGAKSTAYTEGNYTKVGIYSSTAEITKVWDDDNDRDKVRPESVTIEVYRDYDPEKENTPVYTHEFPNKDGSWEWTIEYLLRYRDNGTLYEYTYKEIYPNGEEKYYDLDTKSEIKGNNGNIVDVTLTNTHVPEKIRIPVTKSWEDNNDINEKRPRSIKLQLYANGELIKTVTVTADAQGNWSYVFEGLNRYENGVEIEYRVVEEPVKDYVPGYDYYPKTTEDADGNEGEETMPVIPDRVEITNKYYPFGDLILTKTVVDATEEAEKTEFTFTLALYVGENPDTNQYDYTITDLEGNPIMDSEGNELTGKIGNGGTFTLKGGWKIHIKDIPTEDVYTITEASTKSFELTGTVGETGSVSSWAPTEAEFINTYNTKGYAQLFASKTLTGRTLSGYQFRFDVYQIGRLEDEDRPDFEYKPWENDEILPTRTAWNDADGKVSFGQLGYGYEDDGVTYTYAIVEYDEGRGGYTYDTTTVYYVDITPHDDGNGAMTCTIKYYTIDDEGNQVPLDENALPQFNNSYEAEGEIALRAWKQLTGRTLKDGEFEFALYVMDENGELQPYTWETESAEPGEEPDESAEPDGDKEPDENAESDGDEEPGVTNDGANIVFPAIQYTHEDAGKTFRYYLREVKGTDSTVVYSNETICFVVTVLDNGDGTLSFEQSAYDVTCTACDGTGTANCATCAGTGRAACTTCGGSGKTGETACTACNGTGKSMSDCETCNGTGKSDEVCETCNGTGIEIQQDADGNLVGAPIVPVIHNSLVDGMLMLSKYIPSNSTDEDRSQEFKFRVKLTGDKIEDGDGNGITVEKSKAEGTYEEGVGTTTSSTASYSASSAVMPITNDDGNSFVSSSGYTLPDDSLLDKLIAEAREGDYTVKDGAHNKAEDWKMPDESGAVYWHYGNVYFYVIKTGRTVTVRKTNGTNLSTDTETVPEVVLLFAPVRDGDEGYDSARPDGMMGSGWDVPPAWRQDENIRENVTAVIVRDGVSISYGSRNGNDLGANNPSIFNGFTKLVYADLTGLNLNVNGNQKNNAQLKNMFMDCVNLVTVVFGGGDKKLAGRADCTNMFYNCKSLREVINLEIDMQGYNYTMNLSNMFYGCKSLETVNVKIDFKTATGNYNLSNMFNSCSALESLDLSDWDLSNVTDMTSMFQNCLNLVSLNVSSWDTSKVQYMNNMFNGCSSLETLNLSSWDTSNVTEMNNMFDGCSSLETLNLSSWDTNKVTKSSNMFKDCSKLAEVTIGANTYANPNFAFLPAPPTEKTAYTGKWVLDGTQGTDNERAYAPDEFSKNRAPAGTYVWQTASYIIKFEKGDDAAGSMSDAKVTNPAEDYVLPANRFVKYGYTFIGWQDKSDPEKTFRLDKDGVATIEALTYKEGTVTLVPLWEASKPESPELEDGEFEIILHGGETATIKHIPAGTSYQIWEETPAGWVLVKEVDASGEVKANEIAWAKFYNRYDPEHPDRISATIVAQKMLDGKAAGKDGNNTPFAFQLTGEGVNQTVEATDSGAVKFDTLYYDEEGTYTYTITEVKGSNPDIEYDEKTITVTVKVTKDDVTGALTATVTYSDDRKTFYNKTTSGKLEIRKNVDPEYLTEANKDAEFTFFVTLCDPSDLPMTDDELTYYVGDEQKTATKEIRNTNETGYIVQCKAGETIEIRDLPAGTTYEIEEIDVPAGWSWSVESSSELSGSIAAGGTSSATVTNTYSAEGAVALEAHKRLIGDDLKEEAFSFELYEVTGTGDEEKETLIEIATNGSLDGTEQTWVDGAMVQNPWYGTALVKFRNITYTEPGTYRYVIREVVSDAEDSLVVYDKHDEYVTVVVTDNGNGMLTTEVIYEDENGEEIDGALFVNSLRPGSLKISKTVEGPSGMAIPDTEFTFIVTVKDKAGKPLSGDYETIKEWTEDVIWTVTETVTDPETKEEKQVTKEVIGQVTKTETGTVTFDEDGKATIKLKGGESITIDGLPDGATYTITEAEAEHYEQVSPEGAATGEIVVGETAEAKFVNKYSASTEITLKATKHFLGGVISEGMFTFELYDLDDTSGKPIQTVTVKPREGNESWGDIEFTLSYNQDDVGKTFRYKLSEKSGTKSDDGEMDIEYDENYYVYYVEVREADDGGIVAEVIKVLKNNSQLIEQDDDIVFTNTKLFDLTISKKVTGIGGDRTQLFDFYVYLESEKDLSQVMYELNSSGNGDRLDSKKAEEGEVRFPEGVDIFQDGKIPEGGAIYWFQLKDGDTLTIKDLPYGTQYKVWEVLDGKITKLYDTTITVNGEGESSDATDDSATATPAAGNGAQIKDRTVIGGDSGLESDVTIAFVNNNDNVQLPETGGTGMKMFYTASIAVMLTAGVLWLYDRKRRYGQR